MAKGEREGFDNSEESPEPDEFTYAAIGALLNLSNRNVTITGEKRSDQIQATRIEPIEKETGSAPTKKP